MNMYGYCFDDDMSPWTMTYYTSLQSAYNALKNEYAEDYECWGEDSFPSFDYVTEELWNGNHVVPIGNAYLFECYVETR